MRESNQVAEQEIQRLILRDLHSYDFQLRRLQFQVEPLQEEIEMITRSLALAKEFKQESNARQLEAALALAQLEVRSLRTKLGLMEYSLHKIEHKLQDLLEYTIDRTALDAVSSAIVRLRNIGNF